MRRPLASLLAALALAPAAALAQGSAAAPTLAGPGAATWTRGATCYEVFVRSFQDGDGDGIGDLKGLTRRLDYLNDGDSTTTRDLGVRCLWLMPVAESPSYHGYDVTDYYAVERDYGTRADWNAFVEAAHRRGIKVLVDLVLNHTSSEHPFFRAAMADTASPYRRWYRWSRTNPMQKGTWGQDVWAKSPARDEWYYAVFWSGMPDLNYEEPAVREEAHKVARFWLDSMQVDGFRLDAVPFLVESGQVVAHTRGTHEVLRDFAAEVRRRRPDAWTIGEVWFPTDTMLSYYPDQLDAYFAFDVADAIVNGVRAGDASGVLAPAVRLQQALAPDRYSPFLRNHDQPRTATELGGDVRKARLASLLLLTMPGVPFVYYGEELGMTGPKPDERIRTPMGWDRSAHAGFTTGKPWQPMMPDSMTANVAALDAAPGSILDLHRRLIQLRARNAALASGTLVPLAASDKAVTAFVRRDGDRAVLVVANLSTRARPGVTVSAPAGTLPAGTWTPRTLLGGANGRALRVAADGSLAKSVVLPSLAPLEGYVFELSR